MVFGAYLRAGIDMDNKTIAFPVEVPRRVALEQYYCANLEVLIHHDSGIFVGHGDLDLVEHHLASTHFCFRDSP